MPSGLALENPQTHQWLGVQRVLVMELERAKGLVGRPLRVVDDDFCELCRFPANKSFDSPAVSLAM